MKSLFYHGLILAALFLPVNSFAQAIQGTVLGRNETEGEFPLPGVNIYWSGTHHGVVSDANGNFSIIRQGKSVNALVFSFIGYANDTVHIVPNQSALRVVLQDPKTLPEYTVTERAQGTSVSRIEPIKTQNISGGELKKAACCNLSESFETNASVDVNYSDAVTGAKVIQLLGLSGTYVQLMFENMPDYQGIHSPFSLSFIPGPWLESIQVSKGAASVAGGFQSITGQINTELKKPDAKEWLYLNVFGNNSGRVEFNGNISKRFSPKLSTMLLVHGAYNDIPIDHNDDYFMDMPLLSRYHIVNRWKYFDEKKMFQIGAGILSEDRLGGQHASFFSETQTAELYQTKVGADRLNFFAKGGIALPGSMDHSLAFLSNASFNSLHMSSGHNYYTGEQSSLNARLVYRMGFNNDKHVFLFGASEFYDAYTETYNDSAFSRIENVPGALAEYTFKPSGKLTLMTGLRYDIHNLYGGFFTPRFHFRYSPVTKLVIRGSIGTGRRSPNLFVDNNAIMATSRSIFITQSPEMEVATNIGISSTYYTNLQRRDLVLSLDLHRTSFENQLIIDFDSDAQSIIVSNLNGSSYSNNAQLEASYEPIKRLQLLAAVRYTDVKQSIAGQLIDKAFVKNFKGLLTASYLTNLQKWQFDATVQFNGSSRLPMPSNLPQSIILSSSSPAYTIVNAQVTKNFRHWSLYLGVENLTGFKQHNPIIGNDDPFGDYFDAGRIWGPLDGRKIYGGIRFSLETKEDHHNKQ